MRQNDWLIHGYVLWEAGAHHLTTQTVSPYHRWCWNLINASMHWLEVDCSILARIEHHLSCEKFLHCKLLEIFVLTPTHSYSEIQTVSLYNQCCWNVILSDFMHWLTGGCCSILARIEHLFIAGSSCKVLEFILRWRILWANQNEETWNFFRTFWCT